MLLGIHSILASGLIHVLEFYPGICFHPLGTLGMLGINPPTWTRLIQHRLKPHRCLSASATKLNEVWIFFPLTPNPARHAARVLSSEKRRPRTPSLETTPNSARIRHSSLHLRLLAPPTPGLSSNPRDDPRDNLQPKFFLSPKEKSAFCCVLMGQLRPDSGPLGP